MTHPIDKPGDRDHRYFAGFIGLLIGSLATFLFRYTFYDWYYQTKSFPDYGPSLYTGVDPIIWTILYVVLVVSSFMAACLFDLLLVRTPRAAALANRFPTGLIFIIISSLGVIITPAKLATLTGNPSGLITQSVYLLLGLSAIWCLLRFQVARSALLFENVVLFFFGAMLLLQAPKIHGIYYLIQSSGEQPSFVAVLLASVVFISVIAYTTARTFDPKSFGRMLGLLVAVYVLSIMEGRIYWGSDGFHDAEQLLSGAILIGKSSISPTEVFVPIHGYLRNIWPSYISTLIRQDDYFILGLTQSLLLVPIVNVCLVACVIGLSRRLVVGIGVFCIIYLFKIFIPFDNDMVVTVVVLISLLKPVSSWLKVLQRVGLGSLMLLLSLVSFELMLFVNIALVGLLAKIVIDYCFCKAERKDSLVNSLIPHLAFYGGSAFLLVINHSRFLATLDLLIESFSKSPNLLERDLIVSGQFETVWFYIFAFAPVGIWFCLSNLSSYMRFSGSTTHQESTIRIFVSMLFLMFLVRAFNRSDDGHVLYGMWVMIPLALGCLIRDKVLDADRFIGVVALALLGLTAIEIFNGRSPVERFKQAAWYDSRVSRESIKPIENIGRLRAPSGTIGEQIISREELRRFIELQTKGYDLFDMINLPTVFYGAAGFRILTNDFHTLFLNTYKEQKRVIERLQQNDRALIAWSADYWTETLDYTYVETRLPMITQFITSEFKHVYKIGRFVVLSKYEVLELADAKAPISVLRKDYFFGSAPAKMNLYKQEVTQDSAQINLSDTINRKPDALRLVFPEGSTGKHFLKIATNGGEMVSVGFQVTTGADSYFLRLSNLPRYNMEDDPIRISVVDESGLDVTNCRATGLWLHLQ